MQRDQPTGLPLLPSAASGPGPRSPLRAPAGVHTLLGNINTKKLPAGQSLGLLTGKAGQLVELNPNKLDSATGLSAGSSSDEQLACAGASPVEPKLASSHHQPRGAHSSHTCSGPAPGSHCHCGETRTLYFNRDSDALIKPRRVSWSKGNARPLFGPPPRHPPWGLLLLQRPSFSHHSQF